MTKSFIDLTAARGLNLAAAAVALGVLVAPAMAFPGDQAGTGARRPVTTQAEAQVDAYGVNAHPDHPGTAGIYDCGPGSKATRLSQKSCGGIDRFGHLSRD